MAEDIFSRKIKPSRVQYHGALSWVPAYGDTTQFYAIRKEYDVECIVNGQHVVAWDHADPIKRIVVMDVASRHGMSVTAFTNVDVEIWLVRRTL